MNLRLRKARRERWKAENSPCANATPLHSVADYERLPFPRPARVIAVTSGKGGVGKTAVTVNLAILLARAQHRVTILDADLGLANVDVQLGLKPRYNLQHVVYGQCELTDVLMQGPHEIRIVPGASGIVELANLDDARRRDLLDRLSLLNAVSDVILIDTSPGVSRNVVSFAAAADEVMVVTTPEPTALTDAYAVMKVIVGQTDRLPHIRLLVNMARDDKDAQEVTEKLSLVTRQFLNLTVESLGYLPSDPHVPQAIRQQTPFVLAYPYSPASQQMGVIAGRVGNGLRAVPLASERGSRVRSFFERVCSQRAPTSRSDRPDKSGECRERE